LAEIAGMTGIFTLDVLSGSAHQSRIISTALYHIVFAMQQIGVWAAGPTVETRVRPGVNVGSRPHLEKMQRTGIYAAFFLVASAFFAAASAFFVSASTCFVLNVGLSL